jgi:hypothetical protein
LLALELVAPRIDALDEQVHRVGGSVGERPGDIVVLAEGDPDPAGERGTAAKPITEVKPQVVGDPRHARREVRVAGEQRAAGGRTIGGDRPVVGARDVGREPELLTQRRDLLDDRRAVALPRLPRRQHHRIAGRVAGVEPGRELGTQGADEVGAQQLAFPVAREAERQQLGHGEGVGGTPRLELEPLDLELDRQRARARRRVDPRGVGAHRRAEPLFQLRLLAQRDPPQAESADEAVELHPLSAGDLRQPTRGQAAVEVELPEPVLAVAVALAEPEVSLARGADVRNAPAVAPDLHGALDPDDVDRALDAR